MRGNPATGHIVNNKYPKQKNATRGQFLPTDSHSNFSFVCA